jgi:hypothetical protein
MASRILIVDPLTLLGRELIRAIEDSPDLTPDLDYRHTSPDDEHQIAELGAEPALVPPLEGVDDIAEAGIVVIATDTVTERARMLEDLLIRHPELSVVDVGRLSVLDELTYPAASATVHGSEHRHLRVAHPALIVASTVVKALRSLSPVRGAIAAVDPVSIHGRDAIETLVHQAGKRMQGGEPDETIDGHILAFNQVTLDAESLAIEAAELIPDVPMAVTRTIGGCFHGHVAHLAIELADPVDDFEIRDAFEQTPEIVLADPPLGLDAVPDRDQILVSQPQVASDRRVIACTAMVDGLRIGGALTAVEILRAMTVH